MHRQAIIAISFGLALLSAGAWAAYSHALEPGLTPQQKITCEKYIALKNISLKARSPKLDEICFGIPIIGEDIKEDNCQTCVQRSENSASELKKCVSVCT